MTQHRCFACDEDNPERIVTNTDDGWTFKFIDRFVGLADRVHGGLAVGALTCPALQLAKRDGMLNPIALNVTGRFNLAVPLAKPIRATAHSENDQYRVQLHDNSNIILDGQVDVVDREVKVGSVIQEPTPERVEDLKALSELSEADVKGPNIVSRMMELHKAVGFPWEPRPACFGCCGRQNGLKVDIRSTWGGDVWTRWKGEASFTDGNGSLATAIVAAALDCVCLAAVNTNDDYELIKSLLREKKNVITGIYGVRFLRVPPLEVDGDYHITSRYLGRDGRKLFSISALSDRKGKVYAMGETVGIIFDIKPEMMGAKT